MVEPANRDPGVVDPSTEESTETTRRREAALLRRAVQEAYCKIHPSLYIKAWDQRPLTEDEREVFLSCGDILGRAIAYPDSTTTDEIHEACAWAPPDLARANIQRATGGTLSTPTELYAKAKDALDHGEFDAVINDEEALLIVNGFYTRDDDSRLRDMAPHAVPGFGHALTLLSRRLGLHIAVFKACWTRRWEVMRRSASGTTRPAKPVADSRRMAERSNHCRRAVPARHSVQARFPRPHEEHPRSYTSLLYPRARGSRIRFPIVFRAVRPTLADRPVSLRPLARHVRARDRLPRLPGGHGPQRLRRRAGLVGPARGPEGHVPRAGRGAAPQGMGPLRADAGGPESRGVFGPFASTSASASAASPYASVVAGVSAHGLRGVSRRARGRRGWRAGVLGGAGEVGGAA